MQLGISRYVTEVEAGVDRALRTARSVVRRSRATLGQASPAGAARACRPVPASPFAHVVHRHVVRVGRPVPVEIVEKSRPAERQLMHAEVVDGEREAVVDADDRRAGADGHREGAEGGPHDLTRPGGSSWW